MDPKNLDPKLQEAYNRVMNTPTEGGNQAPQQDTASPAPEQNQQDVAALTEIPVQQAASEGGDSSNPWQGSGIPSAPTQVDTPQYQQSAAYPQDHSSQMKLIFIVGGVFFMLLYALFWLKILGFF